MNKLTSQYNTHCRKANPLSRGEWAWRRVGRGVFFSALAVSILLPLLILTGCQPKTTNEKQVTTHCVITASLPVKYAKGFTVDYYEGFKLITVRDWKDSAKIWGRYIVLPKGKAAPVDFKDAVLIDTPARRVVCFSTNNMAQLRRLGLTDRLAGITNLNLIYDSGIVDQVKSGAIADLGGDEMNYEKLVSLNPSFVFTSGLWDGGDKLKLKLDAIHVKSVLNLDYMEQDPIARAEWLKFVGALFDCEYEADSIFNVIEGNYLALKEKAKSVSQRPTVFCNIPFKEVWYMPGGENYMSRLFTDAGGDFLWKDSQNNNGLNINLDYEAVYNKAADADYWLNPGFTRSLKDIRDADKKNAFFKAFKTGNVYNNNLRNTAAEGFDFWESGAVNPDLILADLIFILHPELLPGHKLYYYQKLK